jgi:hypothetical protein
MLVGDSPQVAALLGPALASHISLCPLTQLRASSLAASNCSGPHLKITDDSKLEDLHLYYVNQTKSLFSAYA